MRIRLIAAIALLICLAPEILAQNTITTVAGGVPNNVPALAASLSPQAVFKDSANNLYISDIYCYCVFKVNSSGLLTVVAGNGSFGFSGDGGLATNAQFEGPAGIFVDSAGNIFIADDFDQRIREVVAATGIIQTVAGNGTGGFNGDGGLATSAELSQPTGVFVDAAGNIFVADDGNSRIRKIAAGTGIIRTVAGNGTRGFSGDGALATNAELTLPFGVFVDPTGNIFIADNGAQRIREVIAGTGIIQTVAGNGTAGFSGDGGQANSAQLSQPSGVFVDGTGNIFIADDYNERIRKVTVGTGIIQTIAGNGTAGISGDGGPAATAELFNPLALFVDVSGNIYIVDSGNARIREVASGNGNIQTIAGNGFIGFSGDGGVATSAELDFPTGVSVDTAGNIFIADTENSRIREVASGTGIIQTIAGNGSFEFSGDGGPATSASLGGPQSVFVDGAGNIFIADDNSAIRKVAAGTGIIQTVAGNGTGGFSGDGGPATSAEISDFTAGVFVDRAGNIFIADSNNSRIRKVDAGTGIIQTVAGNGTPGFTGDGGPATGAELSEPVGVFVDGAGNIFIADSDNSDIRKVAAGTGIIQTVAGGGGGCTQQTDAMGDGCPATSAELGEPGGVFVDTAGNIFIGDGRNSNIREVVATTGIIQTVAGNGTEGFGGDGGPAANAEFDEPTGIAGDANGNIFVADSDNNRIRKIAGLGSFPASIAATGGTPQSATVNSAFGTVFTAKVTDSGGNALSGVTVTFAAPGSGASGTFAGGVNTVVTNAQGIASSPIFTANGIAGSYAVTASVTGVPLPATFSLTNTAVTAVSIVATSGTPQTQAVKTAFAAPLAATVRGSDGNLLGGVTVTFTAPTTGASGTFAGGSNTAVTNAQGVAMSAVLTANGIIGNYTVAASVPGVSATANFSLTNKIGAPTSVAATTGTPQNAAVSTAFSAPLVATVTDAGGNVVGGVTVTFTAPATGASGTFAGGVITAVTNAQGVATSTVFTANATAGSYTVTASVPGAATASFLLTNAATVPAPIVVTISPEPTSAVVGSTIQFGAVVQNAGTTTVTWQVLSGPGTGSIDPSSGLYTPPTTPPAGNVVVQATSVADPTKNQQISFSIAQLALNFAPGQSPVVPPITSQGGGSSSAELMLNPSPSSGTGTFALTCDQMPPGAACTIAPNTVTVLPGQRSSPFKLTVFATVSSSGGVVPATRIPRRPWSAFVISILGSIFVLMGIRRLPLKQTRYAYLLIALVCFSLAFLAACSGISQTTVSSPVVPSVRAGTIINARVTATPTGTTGNFTATQMIVPFPIQ